MQDERPDPSQFLIRLKEEEAQNSRGRLKIFFGFSAGVGKTFAMLTAGRKLKGEGVDLVVGCVETHGRAETAALLEGLEVLPRLQVEYRGTTVEEFDIDLALSRKPKLVLVDELAHTNAPGSRHAKRWQDVHELLEAGIDVFTTLNVQHIESLHDVVSQITGVTIHERVPDSLLDTAFEFELVDLPPDDLIQRMREGRVYMAEKADQALNNFFRKGNLIALRELALRFTAEHVDNQMLKYRETHMINETWPASERVLVCVSPSPLSIRLVRAAKRMSAALRAKWFVAFVETPGYHSLPDADRARMVQTLRLAEQLGAEVVELSGDNVAEEITRFARRENVSKIVIGKPAQSRWIEILHGSVVDEIIRLSGAIDVYVITGDAEGGLSPHKKPFRRSSDPRNYFKALGVIALSTGIAECMAGRFELSNLIMTYMLGVVVVSVFLGRGPSIFASIISVAAFDFFFVPPTLTFAVSDTQYVVTFVVMLVIALVISTLTSRVRLQAVAARERERRTAALYSMSRELSSTLNIEDLAKIGLRHVADLFASKVALLLPDSSGKLSLVHFGEGDHALRVIDNGVAIWAFKNRQAAGLSTSTLPGAGSLYVPLSGSKNVIGVLAICPADAQRFVLPEQLHLLETFANQMAIALERALLSLENEQARLQVKTEQLRNSLLSSVSHDLRTPLATITGAASSIIEGSSTLDVDACKSMACEIYDQSGRLNRLVGNLLDMTRVESGSLKVKKQWNPVDEIIGSALNALDNDLLGREVVVTIAPELSFVPVDDILIQQVLVNLLENAIKYTPAGSRIDIKATLVKESNQALFAVEDRGEGVPEAMRARIFEKFYRAHNANASGVGLGLAICSGIIEAHGGRIWVETRDGGGASFKFTLPIDGAMPVLEELS